MASTTIVELINLPKSDVVFEQESYSSGLETTVNQLSKACSWTGLFVLGILCRHDAEAIWAAMGSLVNIMLSIIIKRILSKEKPTASLVSELGVPSLHSQSVFYIVMFAISSIVQSLGINVITLTMSGLALAFTSYLSWIRVSQQLHTLSQVVVGACIGTIFSILCYWSCMMLCMNHVFQLSGFE